MSNIGRPTGRVTGDAKGPRDRPKQRSVALSLEVLDALNIYKKDLQDKLGFTPTYSQTLLYLLKRNH